MTLLLFQEKFIYIDRKIVHSILVEKKIFSLSTFQKKFGSIYIYLFKEPVGALCVQEVLKHFVRHSFITQQEKE